MLQTNEQHLAARTTAPRPVFARTSAAAFVRIGTAVTDERANQLEEIVPTADVRESETTSQRLRAEPSRDGPIKQEWGGPVYRFSESLSDTITTANVSRNNRELMLETFPWLFEEFACWWPYYAAVADGTAVSVGFSARRGVSSCNGWNQHLQILANAAMRRQSRPRGAGLSTRQGKFRSTALDGTSSIAKGCTTT